MNFSSVEKILVENMTDLAYVRDLDQNLIYINPAAEELIGVLNDEIRGRKCYELFGDSKGRCRAICPVDEAIAQNKKVTHREGEISLGDGRSCDVRVAISPLQDNGEPAGAVVVMQDISSLKEIEKAQVNTLMELQRERAMFYNGPVAMIRWRFESGWPVQYVSENITAITGYSKAEWEQGRLKYLDQLLTEDRVLVESDVEQMLEHAVSDMVHSPYRFVRKDGNIIWLTGYTTITKNEHDGTTQISGYLIDVTKDRLIEKANIIQRDLTVRLGSTRNLNEAIMTTLQACMQIDGVECAGFYLVDDQKKELNLVGNIGLSPAFAEAVSSYPAGDPQTEIIMIGKPIYTNYNKRVYKRDCTIRDKEGLQALAVIPVVHEGDVVVSLHLASRATINFPPFSRNLMELLAAQVGSVVARFRAETGVRQIRKLIEKLFESLDDFIFVLDEEGKIIHSNRAVEKRLGYTSSDLYGKSVLEVHPEERRAEAASIVGDIIAGKTNSCHIPIVTKQGELLPVETIISRAEWEGRDVYLGISRDISRQVAIEREKKLIEERLLTALDVIDEGFVLFSKDDRLVMTNARYRELYKGHEELIQPGTRYEDMIRGGVDAGFYPEAAGCEEEWINHRLKVHSKCSETLIQRLHDGKWIKVAERKTPNGSTVGFRVDITSLKATEQELYKALKEEDVLLREIHHRVKNNMAVISSLLSLQAKRVEEPQVRYALEESQGRIQSMALVHECLYQSESVSEIDLEKYFRKLSNAVSSVFHGDSARVVIEIDTDQITMPMTQAIPCGIILNEAVTNAFKYAFKEQDKGKLHIAVCLRNGWYKLTVTDDGCGFAQDPDVGRRKTMGLWLISLMSDQLKAELDISGDDGVAVSVEWRAD